MRKHNWNLILPVLILTGMAGLTTTGCKPDKNSLALLQAVEANNLDQVLECLEKGANVNTKNDAKLTAFQIAANKACQYRQLRDGAFPAALEKLDAKRVDSAIDRGIRNNLNKVNTQTSQFNSIMARSGSKSFRKLGSLLGSSEKSLDKYLFFCDLKRDVKKDGNQTLKVMNDLYANPKTAAKTRKYLRGLVLSQAKDQTFFQTVKDYYYSVEIMKWLILAGADTALTEGGHKTGIEELKTNGMADLAEKFEKLSPEIIKTKEYRNLHNVIPNARKMYGDVKYGFQMNN